MTHDDKIKMPQYWGGKMVHMVQIVGQGGANAIFYRVVAPDRPNVDGYPAGKLLFFNL